MAQTYVRVYITKGTRTSTLKFSYNEDIIEIVRGFIGRQWDPVNHTWTIYNHDLPKFEYEVKKLGHNVHYVTAQGTREEGNRRNQRARQDYQRSRESKGAGAPRWEDAEAEDDSDPFADFYDHFTGAWGRRQDSAGGRWREEGGPGRSGARTTADSEREWAVQLFRKVGKRRAKAVYRALVKVLHQDLPDRGGEEGGGDKDLIQQLNDAYEPWKKMD